MARHRKSAYDRLEAMTEKLAEALELSKNTEGYWKDELGTAMNIFTQAVDENLAEYRAMKGENEHRRDE